MKVTLPFDSISVTRVNKHQVKIEFNFNGKPTWYSNATGCYFDCGDTLNIVGIKGEVEATLEARYAPVL